MGAGPSTPAPPSAGDALLFPPGWTPADAVYSGSDRVLRDLYEVTCRLLDAGPPLQGLPRDQLLRLAKYGITAAEPEWASTERDDQQRAFLQLCLEERTLELLTKAAGWAAATGGVREWLPVIAFRLDQEAAGQTLLNIAAESDFMSALPSIASATVRDGAAPVR